MSKLALNLEGKRVVVLGAGQGIGYAIATSFAAQGCRVMGVDRTLPADSESHAAIEFVQGDVTVVADMQRVAAAASDVQHVVYSAGVGSGVAGSPFWNVQPTDWVRVVDVNLMGAVNVAHVFAPMLADQGSGTFLFLVSVAGQTGSPTDPPYSAAKAALINFMQCAAKDLAAFGVRANALSPGMVQTELNRSVWQASQAALPASQQCTYDAWAAEKLQRVSPLGHWQEPDEFGAMAVFLASHHARSITGQTINIDGGQVMHC